MARMCDLNARTEEVNYILLKIPDKLLDITDLSGISIGYNVPRFTAHKRTVNLPEGREFVCLAQWRHAGWGAEDADSTVTQYPRDLAKVNWSGSRSVTSVSLNTMVRCCSVNGCKTNQNNKGNLMFHIFPKDEETQKKWISLCGRKRHQLKPKHARICSLHFKLTDYERNLKYELLQLPVPRLLHKIKQGAVPTLHLPPSAGKTIRP